MNCICYPFKGARIRRATTLINDLIVPIYHSAGAGWQGFLQPGKSVDIPEWTPYIFIYTLLLKHGYLGKFQFSVPDEDVDTLTEIKVSKYIDPNIEQNVFLSPGRDFLAEYEKLGAKNYRDAANLIKKQWPSSS